MVKGGPRGWGSAIKDWDVKTLRGSIGCPYIYWYLVVGKWQGRSWARAIKNCDVGHCAQNCVRQCARGQSPENWHLLPPFHLVASDLIANSEISLQKAKTLFFQPPKSFGTFSFFNGTHRLSGRVNQSNKDVLLLSDACNYWVYLSGEHWQIILLQRFCINCTKYFD